MTKLDDLNDDCLSQILDRLPANELFKMLGISKIMRRVADNMIRNKIRAITFSSHEDSMFSTCSHLGAIRQDQVLFLERLLKNISTDESTKLAFFSSVLFKCSAVKCFDCFLLPNRLFMEAFPRCPEVECLKLCQWVISKKEWNQIFKMIGHRIVHLVKYEPQDIFTINVPTDLQLLENVVKKCPNIKRVDWKMKSAHLVWPITNRHLVAAFKSLPTGCWIALDCDAENTKSDIEFEDVVDELTTHTWNWSHFGHRVDRLTNLKWNYRSNRLPSGAEILSRGVEFAGLKKLDVDRCLNYDNYLVGCLVASQFPQLEEFHFDASGGFTENNFDAIFQRMKSVKKLTISWTFTFFGVEPLLPGSAINQLKQLKTIEFNIKTYEDTSKPDVFFHQFEKYVEISSLKKLAVYLYDRGFAGWKEPVEEKVEQLKMKQNRVKVGLAIRKRQAVSCKAADYHPRESEPRFNKLILITALAIGCFKLILFL